REGGTEEAQASRNTDPDQRADAPELARSRDRVGVLLINLVAKVLLVVPRRELPGEALQVGEEGLREVQRPERAEVAHTGLGRQGNRPPEELAVRKANAVTVPELATVAPVQLGVDRLALQVPVTHAESPQ